MLTASQLTWPGIDKERARAAVWHLTRALQVCEAIRRHPNARHRLASAGSVHLRHVRGYLGAVGFEHHGRLWS